MKIKIVGGSSRPKSITISSDKYISTATCQYYDGISQAVIDCEVKKVSPIIQKLRRFKKWPIPRLFFLLVALWTQSKAFGKAWMILMVISFILPAAKNSQSSSISYGPIIFLIVVLIALIIWLRKSIATWHAAEHMAISCYEKSGAYNIDSIKKEDRFNRKCGGRLMLPLILASALCFYLDNFDLTGLSLKILNLIALEVILWVDYLIGFDRIPVFSHASYWLQKYVTTKQPGDDEIRTAAYAVYELVQAHEKN
jgi:uncharacterized protein YqhQ